MTARSRSSRRVLVALALGSLGAGPFRCRLSFQLDLDGGPPDTGATAAGSGSGSGAGSAPPPVIAATARREESTQRQTLIPKAVPATARFAFPEEVVLGAVRTLQPTFNACWRRAQRTDPTLVSARVRLSLEIDAAGAVTASRADAEDAKLGSCLSHVARGLSFPASGKAVALDVPLFF